MPGRIEPSRDRDDPLALDQYIRLHAAAGVDYGPMLNQYTQSHLSFTSMTTTVLHQSRAPVSASGRAAIHSKVQYSQHANHDQ